MTALAVLCALASLQDADSLSKALDLANSSNTLACVRLIRQDDYPGWNLADFGEAAKGLPTVKVTLDESGVWRGSDIRAAPSLAFLDGNGNPCGFLIGPVSSHLAAKWTQTVRDVWKRHDALEFRVKGRPGDRDRALFGFSLAARLDLPRAQSMLASLDMRRPTLESELAWFNLAQAYWVRKQDQKALEAFGKLRSIQTSDLVRSAARIRWASLVTQDKPQDAREELQDVLKSSDLEPAEKAYAQALLDQLPPRSVHAR